MKEKLDSWIDPGRDRSDYNPILQQDNALAKICATKMEHLAHYKEAFPVERFLPHLSNVAPGKGFLNALKNTVSQHQVGLIAEVKKASPSKGIIREDFNPLTIADAYVKGGATCISVLTDMPYFQGHNEYLVQVKKTVNCPILRKDFILDPYQVLESKVLGADCILLIMAALSDDQARELEELALRLDMDVLVEVHDREELDRALSTLKTRLLGINNRDLKTLQVDLAVTENLSPYVPAYYTTICESGVTTFKDILRIQEYDVHCFLVGESLMREADVELATKKLLFIDG